MILLDTDTRGKYFRFDEHAAKRFGDFRRQRIRIGTQDLKIASIALEHNAMLLSANISDFQQVPSLRVKDWLHG
jgi:tRNA(fMet)-specific endonuclease VapC